MPRRKSDYDDDDSGPSGAQDKAADSRDRGSGPNDYEGKQNYRDSGGEYPTKRDLG